MAAKIEKKSSKSKEQPASNDSKIPEFKDGESIGEWKVELKLGEGGFGAVYKVKDATGQYYAMKTESETAPLRVLKMDVLVLREMARKSAMHFCRIKEAGNVRQVNYVVMSLVGKSVNDLRRLEKTKHFTLGCALLVGVQCIEAIEELHSSGFIHRDIKSGNFAIGRNEPKRIFLIDFGMCRRFLDKANEVRKPRWACGFRGTIPYASISCHISREMCRKDDLESWIYSQVEMTNGELPWRKEKDMDKVLKAKMDIREGDPMRNFFASCPRAYIEAMNYVDGLCYYDMPNYKKLINDFKECIIRQSLQNAIYDWEKASL